MKKIKIYSFLALMLCFLPGAFAQSDTTYYDGSWGESDRKYAVYFRPAPVAEKGGYRVKDYFRSGAIQMSAFSKSATEDIFDGEANWYYESGELQQKATFKNGLQEGPVVVYDQQGKVLSEGIYQNNRPFNGTFSNIHSCCQTLEEYKNGKLLTQIITDLPGGSKAKMEVKYKGGEKPVELNSYEQSGKYIGKLLLSDAGKEQDGIGVNYNYHPMTVQSTKEFSNGILMGATHYYSDGKVKKKDFMAAGSLVKEAFYDQQGKLLDTLTYMYGAPYTGTLYQYKYDYQAAGNDLLSLVQSYSKGELHGPYTIYHENGVRKEKGVYKMGQQEGKVFFYDENGKELFTGIYENGYSKEGTFRVSDNELKVYKSGSVKETRTFYPGGQPQRLSIPQVSDVFYDTVGNVLSRLSYREGEPYEGKFLYFYGNNPLRVQEYRNGRIVMDQSYAPEGAMEFEYFYDEGGNLTRTLEFYSNGKKKTDNEHIGQYEKKITYYNQQEQVIGQVHYGADTNGDEFWFQGDVIRKVIKYKDSQEIGKKVYTEAGKLLYEIDYTGNAVFYDKNGKLLGKATYRDGNPYSGTVFAYADIDMEVQEQTSYKNGLLHGNYVKYEKNYSANKYDPSIVFAYKEGKKEGDYKEFNKGILLTNLIYKDDLKEGIARFYDKNGQLLSEARYKNDKPYQGTFYRYRYDASVESEESYKEGKKAGEFRYFDYNGLLKIEKYNNDQLTELIYYLNPKVPYKIIYKEGEPYEGTVVGYASLTQYKAGKKIRHTYYFDNACTRLDTEIVYDEKSDKAWMTTFYENGQKKSTIGFLGAIKNGEASFYYSNGKLMGKGVYDQNQPVMGTFVYDHYNQPENYIMLEIKEQLIRVDEYNSGEKVFSLQSELLGVNSPEKRQDQIFSFYELLSSKYGSSYRLETD